MQDLGFSLAEIDKLLGVVDKDDKSLHECPIIETLMDDITERKEK